MLFFWGPVLRSGKTTLLALPWITPLSAVLSNAILALSGTVYQFPSYPYLERLSQASRAVSFLPSIPLFLLVQHLNSHPFLPLSCTHSLTHCGYLRDRRGAFPCALHEQSTGRYQHRTVPLKTSSLTGEWFSSGIWPWSVCSTGRRHFILPCTHSLCLIYPELKYERLTFPWQLSNGYSK